MPDKAVLSTKEAQTYVGGQPFFRELIAAYPHILQPIRQCKPTGPSSKGKTQYLRSVIDQSLKMAQMDRQFVKG